MTSETDPIVYVRDVDVGYGRPPRRGRVVLAGVRAALHAGQLTCLIGPNGSGKSTLLRSLVRSQPLLGGDVLLGGRSITRMSAIELARQVAVVLTDRVAVGALPAWHVVALGRYPHSGWAGRLDEHDRAVVDQSLAAAGATELAGRSMTEMSDGERQRIMIARALAQQPQVLVLDEPGAFLDVRARLELTTLIRSLTRDHGLAVLMSTHDVEHMLRHADHVWLVTGAGRVETGTPADLGLDVGVPEDDPLRLLVDRLTP
ncbi:ABC transporter ATP-binding protein [Phytoactinopolyspora limicola]|uniref:ABC transporter ATP-binding protein n=1 Tax=Phytoactinopolyspora limicola TaxID=2715536 RepID=UPI00140B4450|nr:ABC transporter ATP-binding protein [Phytoactinopolyspora limicola]